MSASDGGSEQRRQRPCRHCRSPATILRALVISFRSFWPMLPLLLRLLLLHPLLLRVESTTDRIDKAKDEPVIANSMDQELPVEPVCQTGYSTHDSDDDTCKGQGENVHDTTTVEPKVPVREELFRSTTTTDDSSHCGLYLAKSTIPGAGLGLFTAVAKQVGDTIGLHTNQHTNNHGSGSGGSDGCIPLVDWNWHNTRSAPSSSSSSVFDPSHPLDPFTHFLWNGQIMGMHEETSRGDVEALCPGLDCAVNCHLALTNVGKSFPSYDDGTVAAGSKRDGKSSSSSSRSHRTTNPGAGAYSPYWNSTSYVVRDIPAGGELFKQYGDNWFVVRHHVFGNIPLTQDYLEVTRLLSHLGNLRGLTNQEPQPNKNQSDGSLQTNLLEQSIARDLYENVLHPMKARFDSRILNALPNRWSDAVRAIHANDVTVTLQEQHTVSLEYLHTHGVCMDHMTVSHSTVPFAGHGAFATRAVRAGSVISASPLFHVPYDTVMNMYNFTTKDMTASEHRTMHSRERQSRQRRGQDWIRLVDEVDHTQLLINYCYGDPNSSLLLCPYGSGVNYINHNRTLRNVRIEWATSVYIGHNDSAIKVGTIQDLAFSSKPQLAFQYVATRDIQRGDELFMDYGVDWEDAWLNHIAPYPLSPPADNDHQNPSSEAYASAHYWNWEFSDLPVRTERQQQIDPYPDNLQIRCHRTLLMRPPPMLMDNDNTNARHVVYRWSEKDYGLPCRILDRFMERSDDQCPWRIELYTIQLEWITYSEATDSEESVKTVTWVERTDVPRSSIRFFDVPSTTDLHQPHAFRHFIGIPDDIFPSQWRNLR